MGTREWILTIGVIVVPLAIAVVVTLWSLEQARYRPKRKRPPGVRRDETPAEPSSTSAGAERPKPGSTDERSQPAA